MREKYRGVGEKCGLTKGKKGDGFEEAIVEGNRTGD